MSNGTIVLQLKKTKGGYEVQIMDSQAKASGFESFRLYDSIRVRGAHNLKYCKEVLDSGDIGSVELARLGEFLYRLLFKGQVAEKMAQIRSLPNFSSSYRLCFRVDESAPFLETIPWEYLRKPRGDYLARSNISIMRVLEDRPAPVFNQAEEIKMLVVCANPPNFKPQDYQKVEDCTLEFINRFVKHLEKDFGIHVTVITHATKSVFLNALRAQGAGNVVASDKGQGPPYDIIHFIGHGEFIEGDQTGSLVLEANHPSAPDEDYEYLVAEDIKYNLNEGKSAPRLFYLNACSTGKANNKNAFSSLAQVLIKDDDYSVPAIVAMQYNVGVADSFEMAEEFYDKLLDSGSESFGNLEAAMHGARKRLWDKAESHYGWGIPILFRRCCINSYGDGSAGNLDV